MFINDMEYPNQILDAIKENKLVVFAGAGVSMGPPTKLPDFEKLTDQLAEGTVFKRKEKESCEVFLGTLKTNEIDVNTQAAKILSETCLKHNNEHEAIINLFMDYEHIKIVTTNYDKMFEQVFDEQKVNCKIYDAPALPLGSDISGIVHIHGSVENPNYMVVTDEDFGKAYLTDGYASRFLAQLFDSYTVLFIGYSYNDTIVWYLTRAMSRKSTQKRYILTDNEEAQWENLGIEPIIYPEGNYELMTDSLEKLGIRAKRGLSEWKECLIDFTEAPPLDMTSDSEIDYCLENEERSKILANCVSGEKWLEYLDNKKVFDNLFSERADWREYENVWSGWICSKIVGIEDEEFIKLFNKHGNQIAQGFSNKILNQICTEQFPSERMHEYILLLDKYIHDSFTIYLLIEKGLEYNQESFCKRLYKKYWKFVFRTEKKYWPKVDFECKHFFLGEAYEVKESWKKCKHFLDPDNAKDLLIFFFFFFEELHYGYCEANTKFEKMEPYGFSMLVIEDREEKDTEDMLVCAIDQMEQLCEALSENYKVYIREYIKDGLYTNSILIKKIFLKLLRKSKLFSDDESFEMIHNMLDFSEGKEQVFLIIKKIFNGMSEDNKNKLIDFIDSLDTSKDYSEYKKFNWCVWIKQICSDNERINSIEKDILSRNDFIPREHPELDMYTTTWSWESEKSSISYEQFKMLSFEEAVDKITFEENIKAGETKRGRLKVLSNVISDDYVWAKQIARILNERKIEDDEIWEHYFIGAYSENYSIDDAISLLCELSNGIISCEKTKELAELLWKIVQRDNYKSVCKEFEDVLFKHAQKIWYKRNEEEIKNVRIIDLTINTTVGKILLSLVYLLSYNDSKVIDKKYKDFFENALLTRTWERKVIIAILAGYFNFFFYRDRLWTNEKFDAILRGQVEEDFAPAWEGIVWFSRSLNKDVADVMSDIYLEAITHIDWITGEARKGIIELYLTLLIYVIPNPIVEYIPLFYRYANEQDRIDFLNKIDRRLFNMEDESQKQWWDAWLKNFVINIKRNKPVKPTEKELKEIINWLPNMKSIYNEAVDILCEGYIPNNYDSQFLHKLKDSKYALTKPHKTAYLITAIMNAGSLSYFADRHIIDIVNDLKETNVLSDEEKRNLKEALLKQNINEIDI